MTRRDALLAVAFVLVAVLVLALGLYHDRAMVRLSTQTTLAIADTERAKGIREARAADAGQAETTQADLVTRLLVSAKGDITIYRTYPPDKVLCIEHQGPGMTCKTIAKWLR